MNLMGFPLGAMQEENPLAQILSQYKQSQLGGGGVTLGNQEAQQDYTRQLAEALAQQKSAQSDLGIAGDLMQPTYAQNSGALGSLAMIAQAYAGKKLRGKAEGREADAMRRAAEASLGAEDQKAEREYAREQKVGERERTRRSSLAQQMGLNRREALEFIETGKVPQAVRGVPMMTNQGLVNVNPYTNEYEPVSPQGSAPPPNVRIDESIPPEIRAAIMQHEQNGQPLPDELNVTGRQQAPLMPYKDPAIEQQRAAAEARANAQLGLAGRAADRADRAFEFAQQQAAEKNKPKPAAVSAMRQDAINFAAAYIGKSPEEVSKMTPEQVRAAVAEGGRSTAGPIVGRIPGVNPMFNADLEAYKNSAAGKQARLNNPTGPVSNADFEIAAKSVFGPEKPAKVNADLIYQALTGGGAAPAAAESTLSPQEQAELDALRKRFGR